MTETAASVHLTLYTAINRDHEVLVDGWAEVLSTFVSVLLGAVITRPVHTTTASLVTASKADFIGKICCGRNR